MRVWSKGLYRGAGVKGGLVQDGSGVQEGLVLAGSRVREGLVQKVWVS